MQKKKIGTLCLAMACAFMPFLALEAKTIVPSDSKIANSIESVNAAPGKIIHSRKVIEGKKYHVTRALINTAPVHVWSLLTDYDRAEEVFTNVKDVQLLSFAGNEKKVKFEVASLGGLWKFNYVLAVTETAPHQIEWRRESGAFKSNEGYWQLEQADSGKSTLVTYVKRIDGGILVPQMMVDRELEKTMPVVMGNLKSAAEKNAARVARRIDVR